MPSSPPSPNVICLCKFTFLYFVSPHIEIDCIATFCLLLWKATLMYSISVSISAQSCTISSIICILKSWLSHFSTAIHLSGRFITGDTVHLAGLNSFCCKFCFHFPWCTRMQRSLSGVYAFWRDLVAHTYVLACFDTSSGRWDSKTLLLLLFHQCPTMPWKGLVNCSRICTVFIGKAKYKRIHWIFGSVG